MKITISGSIAFYNEMQELKKKLESEGHQVFAPLQDSSLTSKTVSLDEKTTHMRNHCDQIAWADCLFVYNHEKKTIPGYIGPNTLLEMGVAFYLHKPIYLMYEIPEVAYQEEIQAMHPIILNGDLKCAKITN